PHYVREAVWSVLPLLFPVMGLDRTKVPTDAGQWAADLRICAQTVFPRYFALSLPSEQVSERDIQAVLDARNSPERFEDLFKELLKSPAHADGIRKLAERTEHDKEMRRLLVDLILPLWEELPTDRAGLSLDDQSVVGVMAYQSIR